MLNLQFAIGSTRVLEFREIRFKPYRIIYESEKKAAPIHAVLDGRRDMESILRHRLLRP